MFDDKNIFSITKNSHILNKNFMKIVIFLYKILILQRIEIFI